MARWLPPNGFTAGVHHMDAKVGGTYKMSFTNFTTGRSHSFGGTYLELATHERIRYTCKFDDPNLAGEMQTTITLKKVSCGAEIDIVQEGRHYRSVKGSHMRSVSKGSKSKGASERIAVENVMSPGHKQSVDAKKYTAMKAALLKVLPKKAPGITGSEMSAAVLHHLPEAEFPGGAKSGWWLKCVQLDLEAKGIVVRETSKPLRWYRAT